MDLDGDGLPDLIETNSPPTDPTSGTPNRQRVWDWRKNLGKANFTLSTSGSGSGLPDGPDDHLLLDIDGDGSQEIVTQLGPYASADSTRYTAVHAGSVPIGSFQPTTTLTVGIQYVFADLNGDGLVDAVELNDNVQGSNLVGVRFNAGTGFFYPVIWANPASQAFGDSFAARVIDFNNDGRQDILLRPKSGYALSSDGTMPLYVLWYDGINLNSTPLPSPVYSRLDTDIDYAADEAEMLEVGDVNGDGLDDIIIGNDYDSKSSPHGTVHVFYRTPAAGRQNRALVKIDRHGGTRNGALPGEEIDVTYAPIVDPTVYTDDLTECVRASRYPWACVEGGLWVVKELQRSDDLHSTSTLRNDVTYTYSGARRDLRGRGFLGFTNVTSTRHDKPITVSTTYNPTAQESTLSFYPFALMPTQVVTTAQNATAEGDTVTWTKTVLNNYLTVHTKNTSYFVYPNTTTETVPETDSGGSTSTLYTNTTTNNYDANGLLQFSTTTRDDGSSDSIQHIPIYQNPDNTWPEVVSDTVVEISTTSAGGTLSRARSFTYDSKWNLVTVTALSAADGYTDRGEQELDMVITPTAEGLPASIVYKSPGDGTSRSMSITYDTVEHQFASVFTDKMGHIHRLAIHPGYGLVAISEDESGMSTTYAYDGFGRIRSVAPPTGDSSTFSYVPAAGDALTMVDPLTAVRQLTTEASGRRSLLEMDWRGHITQRQQLSRPDAMRTYESFYFDDQDRLIKHSPPAFVVNGGAASTRRYDALDRVINELRSDGTSWTYDYEGLQTTETDNATGRSVVTTRDSRGRPTLMAEQLRETIISVLSTSYAYGPFGTLYSTTDPSGNKVFRRTNRLGQLYQLTDADRGSRQFSYNAYGQLATETTPQYTTSSYYDDAGRPLHNDSKLSNGTMRTTAFTWDTVLAGKLSEVDSPDQVALSYGYDGQGRVNSRMWTIAGEKFTLGSQYNSVGQLAALTYPPLPGATSPLQINYNYDPTHGDLTSISDVTGATKYWTYINSNATGQFVSELLGNGVANISSESADMPLALGRIQVTRNFGQSNGTPLRDVSYTFDEFHNLTGRTDNLGGRSETFGYDSLNRLNSWKWLQGTTVKQQDTYGYDSIGNLRQHTVNLGGGTNASFNFDSTHAGPHELLTSTFGSYGYDGNGRQTTAPGRTVGFNEIDLPATITASSGDQYQFSYDGLDQRVLKKHVTGGDTTITLGEGYERKKTASGAITSQYTIAASTGSVAVITATTASSTVHYLHTGHLGQIELITDANGNVTDTLNYEPFGERIGATPPLTSAGLPVSGIDIGFDGLRHDDEASLGLINMHGRVYDPKQARFVSPDPLTPGITSQWLNPYSYVGNNPLTFRDPSGFEPDGDVGDDLRTLFAEMTNGMTDRFLTTVLSRQFSPDVVEHSKPTASSSQPQNYDGRNGAGPGSTATAAISQSADAAENNRNFETWQSLPPFRGQGVEFARKGMNQNHLYLVPWLLNFPFELVEMITIGVVEGAVQGAEDIKRGHVEEGVAKMMPSLLAVGGAVSDAPPGALAANSTKMGPLPAIPGRVMSRINIANGNAKFGWAHILLRHFSGTGSKFLISEAELQTLLRSPDVLRTPITSAAWSEEYGIIYVREATITRIIGVDKNTGTGTSVMTIMTDKSGNLVTAFPGTL